MVLEQIHKLNLNSIFLNPIICLMLVGIKLPRYNRMIVVRFTLIYFTQQGQQMMRLSVVISSYSPTFL